ncbi:hypothetical protein HRI_003731600 [Hibiscus trionum]|uniref:VQ domain-containing protein n=1 Tax=Hibiscus trionum TaxID=183268 RepID=A0A9W7MG62_HIBTR|nr:hypothetical protein HRI_003731600 [Hibiscus trionum]
MSQILSSEWMQLYQQTADSSFAFSDATAVTVTPRPSTSFVAAADDHLAPKGCISKPIRRRSRASKTTPTTLLNADAKNFRSLVQQFTGCRRRSTSTSISFANSSTRGPVHISSNAKNGHHYNHNTTWDHAPILLQPFVDSKQEKHEQQHYQCQKKQVSNEEEEEGEISFDSITSTDHDDLFPQGFVMDDVLFLA